LVDFLRDDTAWSGKEPRKIEVVVDFVDRVHGTGSPEIRPWRPQLAIPVEFVDVLTGTDGS
jgi:hypothetical protein